MQAGFWSTTSFKRKGDSRRAWPVTSIWHLQTGLENKVKAGITCLSVNSNWDGIMCSSFSDPFRNRANWYSVFWLLDWVLEIRDLWLFPELNPVTAHQSWPKHLHCQHTVLKSQKLPLSTAIDCTYVVDGGVCYWHYNEQYDKCILILRFAINFLDFIF